MSKKYHSFSVNDRVWDWAIAADPKGRLCPASFLREILDIGVDAYKEKQAKSVPAAAAKFVAPKPIAPKKRQRIPHQLHRNPRSTNTWSINQEKKDQLDSQIKTDRPVLLLMENGKLIYELTYAEDLLEYREELGFYLVHPFTRHT